MFSTLWTILRGPMLPSALFSADQLDFTEFDRCRSSLKFLHYFRICTDISVKCGEIVRAGSGSRLRTLIFGFEKLFRVHIARGFESVEKLIGLRIKLSLLWTPNQIYLHNPHNFNGVAWLMDHVYFIFGAWKRCS